MLPKIKKKIKSFLMDETGSISKSNIIKGALFLSAATISLKKIKAEVAGDDIGGGNTLEGEDSTGEPGHVAQYTCVEESDGKYHAYKTCTTVNGQVSPACSHHTNTATMKHWNVDDEWHSNYLDFDYDGHTLDGEHTHHGYHADGNALCEDGAHTNHCSHSSHGSHCSWIGCHDW